jgi:hypothetical protein
MKKYSHLIESDVQGLTVDQLKKALANVSGSMLVTFGEGVVACKVAKTYITDDKGDTQVFLEIYDERS